MKAKEAATFKLLLTEALNDLHRRWFQPRGKAESILHDIGSILKEEARPIIKASKLRQYHAATCGACNW